MGCVQSKNSGYSPSQELERLKPVNRYLKAGDSGHKLQGKVDRKLAKIDVVSKQDALVNGVDGKGEKAAARETERTVNNGDINGNVKAKREKIGGDELVEGWPKWLVNNISKKVLEGLVPKSADSYEKLAKVGQGTYSNVYKAQDKDTGKIVALKKVRFDTSEPESVKFMAREIMILQQLNHPNVIKLEGIATSRMQYSLYLVFEYMQSDLTRIISRPGERLSVPQIKCYMEQLLSGLQHCHEKGILHRDIKGSNLLIDGKGELKIADFGLSNTFSPKQKRPLTSRVVTLWYRAPELLLGSTDYGVGIDLWSAGCLLAEMFFGRPIMPGRTEVEQLHRIFKLCGSPSEEYYKKLKLQANFRPPQNYNPSYQEAFSELPNACFSLLTTLLAIDPTDRGTASSALEHEFFCSSPLACDLSGLPVIYKDDEPIQTKERKKRRTSKKPSSRKKREAHDIKVKAEHKRTESESSKEAKSTGQETFNSSSSTSSSLRPIKHEENWNSLLSPILHLNPKTSSTSVGHLNATKHILLQASVTDIINLNHGNPHYRRSISTLDFRKFDPEKISELLRLEEESWDLYEI